VAAGVQAFQVGPRLRTPVRTKCIEIAPVHHRLPGRIRGHALINFLALLMCRLRRLRLHVTVSARLLPRALATLWQITRQRIRLGETEHSGTSRPAVEQPPPFEGLASTRALDQSAVFCQVAGRFLNGIRLLHAHALSLGRLNEPGTWRRGSDISPCWQGCVR